MHLITRNGFDFTDRYPPITEAMQTLRCQSCVIDGEVVMVDGQGLATFDLLRHGPRIKPEAFLYAFDLLMLDGEDLRPELIEARKRALAKLLSKNSEKEKRAPNWVWGFALSNTWRIPTRTSSSGTPANSARRHCLETARLALHVRPIARLDQDQEPGGAGRTAT